MKKMQPIKYTETKTKKNSDFDTTFELQPLERGFANTLGNALRRTLLSSISSVAPFAVKISGIEHEFSHLSDVVQDVVMILGNIKDIKYVYNKEVFLDNAILKCSFKSTQKGDIFAKELKCDPGVEIVNPEQFIATIQSDKALEFEVFITSGRGYVDFDDNRKFIEKDAKLKLLELSKIKHGQFLHVDSDFSPIKNVQYKSSELNSSASIVQEKLEIEITTDKTITSADALAQAAVILMSQLAKIANVENLNEEEIFEQTKVEKETPKIYLEDVSILNLSVRSLNALRRASYRKIADLKSLTIEDLESIKNLGKKSVEEIVKVLKENNIDLRKGEEE